MTVKMSELRCKEVICVANGQRLGFVSDITFDIPEGCIKAIFVPGPCRFWGLFGRKDDYLIPWNCIRRIGPDIILVEIRPEDCLIPRHKFWSV